MNRIKQLFQQKHNNILSIYFTAGYPKLNEVSDIIKTLSDAGVDMIEIGIPFSDPLADGPTIQESSVIALKNGMSVSVLFEQLKNIRSCTQKPLILMGYLNPILQYGINEFCIKAQECGIDGLIIPDLPLREYKEDYKNILARYDLKFIFLVTPQTEEKRIRLIDQESDGFIYLVTNSAVTGGNTDFNETKLQSLNKVKSFALHNPILAGFGISNKEDFDTANQYVNGSIIGSSFIRALKEDAINLEDSIKNFVKSIKS